MPKAEINDKYRGFTDGFKIKFHFPTSLTNGAFLRCFHFVTYERL